MVDGDIDQGVECSVPGFSTGRDRSSTAAAGAICRLCGVAERVDGRRDTAAAGRVLENNAEGSARTAGVAGGPCAAGRAGLCGRVSGSGAGGEADGGVEGTEPAAWDDDVHDVAGGMGCFAGKVVGAGGSGDRNAGSQSGTWRDRELDWIFRQHAGAAGGYAR